MLHLFKDFSRPRIDRDYFKEHYIGAGDRKEIFRLFDFMEASPRVTRTDEVAYMCATILHECGRTMKPVKEETDVTKAVWLKGRTLRYMQGEKYEKGVKHPNMGFLYFGRGYTQVTWWENYLKLEKLMNLPLTSNPDLLLVPENAYIAMELGMFDGIYTDGRHKMSMYFHDRNTDFYNARQIINMMDATVKISTFAVEFMVSLQLKEA